MMAIVELRDVAKSFGSTRALRGVNLAIEEGEIVGLIGPNGAGKTTTLHIIHGLIKPDYGEVKVFNKNPWIYYKSIRKKIGFMPENQIYPVSLSVEDYLMSVAKIKEVASPKREVIRVLEFTELYEYRKRKIGSLSKGLIQRVGLAQALLGDPELLLFDEPTANLDPDFRYRVLELLKEMKGEKTVIISSHILTELELVCTKVVFMNKGVVVSSGDVVELSLKYGLHVKYRIAGNISKLKEKLEKIASELYVSADEKELLVKVSAEKDSLLKKIVAAHKAKIVDAEAVELPILYKRILGGDR